jgi:ATP-dependent DNA ligase
VLPADLLPQLVGNDGVRTMRRAIAEPERFAIEPKVDGVRGMVSLLPGGVIEVRNRQGKVRDWFQRSPLPLAFRALGAKVPLVWDGTVLDGELTAGRFATTMAALYGAKAHAANLSFMVFDMPAFAGIDLRQEPWQERRERLELLGTAFERPLVLSPVVAPSTELVADMALGELEGIVIKDRTAPYRPGSRAGWTKVKDRSWYEREAWRFQRP